MYHVLQCIVFDFGFDGLAIFLYGIQIELEARKLPQLQKGSEGKREEES